ncbi:MAG TPA: phage holin family protein [Propionibacteriaceae bacterium]|nr:phage holin family protein [Propionibacteriaceae bacterium]
MSDPYSPTPSYQATSSHALDTSSSAAEQDTRSIGEILGNVTQDLSTLMRQEVALAKAEATQSATNAGKGIGMYIGAALGGFFFLMFVSIAAWWALGTLIGNGWSALIVAVVWAIIAAILASVGKKEMQKIRGLPDTADTVGKIPNALKGQEERNQ